MPSLFVCANVVNLSRYSIHTLQCSQCCKLHISRTFPFVSRPPARLLLTTDDLFVEGRVHHLPQPHSAEIKKEKTDERTHISTVLFLLFTPLLIIIVVIAAAISICSFVTARQ